MGGALSPEIVEGVQHVNWHLYGSGTPEDTRQKQKIAQENAIIIEGEVQPTSTHILTRVGLALGSRVGDVITKMKYDKDGTQVTYGQRDFKYDVSHKYISLQY